MGMMWYNTNMKRYKKRTIALCLASALTVIGAFGAENYENTLMALKVSVSKSGQINLTAFTEKPYNTPIKKTQVDENTYVLTLKDTNSNASEPNIEKYDNIESIQISTYPYTTESDGCTRVVVKTNGNPPLYASSALFIPDNQAEKETTTYNKSDDNDDSHSYDETEENDETSYSKNNKEVEQNNTPDNIVVPETPVQIDYSNTDTNASNYRMLALCISSLLIIIGLIFMFSKDKMASVVGDQGNFDVNDDDKKQRETKKKKSALKKPEKQYTTNKKTSDFTFETTDEITMSNDSLGDEDETENVVVDLDMLYQESQKTQQPEMVNEKEVEEESDFDDLADLLNSFSTEEAETEEPEEEPFDEDLYNSIINNDKLEFSDADISKINQLLQIELGEETTADLNKYLSMPKKKKMTQEQILEDLLSAYSIKQNIDFTKEDVEAIKKLMNVELGPDFVKDFTTNPLRTKAVEKNIRENAGKKPHKTSEIMTLNVKNMLPDLSEELKKQSNKSIAPEVKPAVVYYSEGYDYKKLSVSDELSDISKNMKNEQNEHKPSFWEPTVATGYDVATLSIKDELPDLADVKANPQKYNEQPPEKPQADERALLRSLSNVTFKPFYEDVENELNQFDNFEVIKSYSYYKQQEKPLPAEQIEEPAKEPLQIKQPEIINRKEDDNTAKLLKLIEEQQTERAKRKQINDESSKLKEKLESAEKQKENLKKAEKQKQQEMYKLDGKTHKVLKIVRCTENSDCKILQNDNIFTIVGSIEGREFILKQYSSLKNASLFVRQNDKADNTQFLVKVGLHKFIIKITKDKMEFVMDLC